MIRKLRRKLMLVLMVILSMLLIAILSGLFFSARLIFERRSINAFSDPPPAQNSFEHSVLMTTPIASVNMDKDGAYHVTQNQIHYVSDEDLIQIAQSLLESDKGFGITSTYGLRYRRHTQPDGSVLFSFSDTFIERDSLKSQIWSSILIGIGSLWLFFVVSILLSRWMVKPVERTWEAQRRFVTDASHELKTPLTVILSNTDMLIEAGAVTDAKNQM